MMNIILFNNIHLGLELLGAVIFIIISFLFFEAYSIKKDSFSFLRAMGFLLLAFWHIGHAVVVTDIVFADVVVPLLGVFGLLLILFSYLTERLPGRPDEDLLPAGGVFAISASSVIFTYNAIMLLFSLLIFFVLIRRYSSDIDRGVRWLAVGFGIYTLGFVLINFVSGLQTFDGWWMIEHGIQFVAFIAFGAWAWQFLSLRIQEEVFIAFVATALFITLFITTAFSTIITNKTIEKTVESLGAGAQVAEFHIGALQDKSLAASQIIANNEIFLDAVREGDAEDMTSIGNTLLQQYEQDFLIVATLDGGVLFRLNEPVAADENILVERVSAEALEGRPAVAIGITEREGLSIRSASPLLSSGEIAGILITGTELDKELMHFFKDNLGHEASLLVGGYTQATTLKDNEEKELSLDELIRKFEYGEVGIAQIEDKKLFASFINLNDFDGDPVATLALSTAPSNIIQEVQRTNRLVLVLIILVVGILLVPLYRFIKML